MPFHALLSTWGGTTIGPLLIWKSWKEILLGIVFVALLVWLLKNRDKARVLFGDRLVLLIAAYALITMVDAVAHIADNGLNATAAGILANLRYLLIFCITYVIFRIVPLPYATWRKYALRFLIAIGATLAVFGLLQVTVIPRDFLELFGYDKYETIAPYALIDDNPDALRAFATLRGPNDYGAFLILPLLASLVIGLRYKFMWIASGLMLVALIVSSSRSAWLGALAAIIVATPLVLGAKVMRSKNMIATIVIGFLVGLGLIYSALTVPALRLAIFHSSPGDSSLTEGSTDAHWDATTGGIQRVIAEPLGCGPGCAGPASYYGNDPKISENYFVQIAEEVGIIGELLFIIILSVIAKRLYNARDDLLAKLLLATGAGIAVIGLWLHVLSDDPLSLTYFAIAGMVLGAHASVARKNVVS